MNKFFKTLPAFAAVMIGLASCDKADDLQTYTFGSAPALTASSALAAPSTTDSNGIGAKLNWTAANYNSYDPAQVIYQVQVDSATKNFSSPKTVGTFTGAISVDMVNKNFNKVVLDQMGYAATVAQDLEIRVISSKANNSEQYFSNVIKYKYTPFIPAVPVAAAMPPSSIPANLFMVGDATPGGWNNPVPVPTQQLTKTGNIFSVTLTSDANKEFLLLPVNGDWSNKFALQNNALPEAHKEGYFGYNFGGNFKGPKKAGKYLYRFDVSTGYYSIVRVG